METLLGGLLVILGGLVVTIVNNRIETRRLEMRWQEEDRRRALDDLARQQEQRLRQIEEYVRTRVALINSLSRPIVQPQTLVQLLLPEIWRMGSESVRARASALLMGNTKLDEYIQEIESLFYKAWEDYQQEPERSQEELDSKVAQLVAKVVLELEQMRVRVSRQNAEFIPRLPGSDT